MKRDLSKPEPDPQPNERPAVWDLVMADMRDRDASGREKYGTPLQPMNGRDALVDAYQEALDLVVYLRQAIWERDNRSHEKALEEANARLRDVLRLAQEGIAVLMQRYDNREMEVQLEAIRDAARD